MSKPMRFSEILPIRLPDGTRSRIGEIARAELLTPSDIARRAILRAVGVS